MANVYRKRKGMNVWHFCPNCPKWPTGYYEESSTKPTTDKLCNECKIKKDSGNCG